MFKLHRTLMAAALLVAATSSSQAAPIVGNLSFVFTSTISISPGNFDAPSLTVTGATTGSIVTSTGGFTTATGVTGGTSPFIAPSAGPYSLTITGLGTFTSTAITFTPADASATNVQIILTGTLTPFSGDANTATLSLSFQKNPALPGLIIGTGILVSPAVPEPSSVVLAGIGIAAAGLFGLRKRFAK